MDTRAVDTSRIPGWGVDIDRTNDPTYPMRDRAHEEAPDRSWVRPPQQPESVEILQSIEHVRRPAVFGTSTPPSGLSGAIRRGAFRYSESQWAHWLLLMLADRVNVVEGLVVDLSRGRIPDLVAEMGLRSELKHNPKALAAKTVATVVVAAVAIGVLHHLTRPRRPVSLYRRLRG